MLAGVPKETFSAERRVAITPAVLAALSKSGIDVLIEEGAGVDSGYPDAEFVEKGATVGSRADVFSKAVLILQVRAFGSNPEAGAADLERLSSRHVVIGFCDPLGEPELARRFSATGATLLSMELMPRITRAQSMDALSSMATIAGYKAVLLAADTLPKMFPMLMTAAGTVRPAKVLVIGAGVAGLQAISAARRLGANVEAYDIRPAVKEQVESLGAKFVELDLKTEGSEDKGGYAKAQSEDFYRRQQELMGQVIAECDAVVTTAAVPGKKAPTLITRAMVEGMRPGSVIVDVAAERGGNCELTRPGQDVVERGVSILGPDNLPSTIPYHASQMYGKNITTFVQHLAKSTDDAGRFTLDPGDEIVAGTLVATGGEIAHPRVAEALGLEPREPAPAPGASSGANP